MIVEVDESPELARSDGPRQLRVEQFAAYIAQVHRVAAAEGAGYSLALEVPLRQSSGPPGIGCRQLGVWSG